MVGKEAKTRSKVVAGFALTPPPNNGMQRSADTKVVMFHQRLVAPADAGR